MTTDAKSMSRATADAKSRLGGMIVMGIIVRREEPGRIRDSEETTDIWAIMS